MIYDCAVIGTGPAGVSAALNLKIRGKNFIWIGSKSLSGKIAKAEQIGNYPGFPDASGEELARAFSAHIEAAGIEITEAMVNAVYDMGTHYALNAGADFYEAKTVILATGVAPKNTLPGEAERVGRGVSYCATCDGALYKGKTVAAILSNPRFEHEAAFLASLASKVWFLPSYRDPGPIGDNAEVVSARPVKIEGDAKPYTLTLSDGSQISADGIFIFRDSISMGTLLPALALDDGHIAVDRRMATNLPGIYAAGDCTGRPYQYAKAVGEGNVAAHSVLDYLAETAEK